MPIGFMNTFDVTEVHPAVAQFVEHRRLRRIKEGFIWKRQRTLELLHIAVWRRAIEFLQSEACDFVPHGEISNGQPMLDLLHDTDEVVDVGKMLVKRAKYLCRDLLSTKQTVHTQIDNV